MDYAETLTNSRYTPKKPLPMPIPKTRILELGDELKKPEDKSLLYAHYLTGARASELIQLECKHFETVTDSNGRDQIKVFMNTRKKRRGLPFRYLPLRSSSSVEQEMLDYLLRHKKTYERVGKNKLFNWNRKSSWRKLKGLRFETSLVDFRERCVLDNEEWHVYPHFLRHCRATDLVTDYGFREHELMLFMGWSSPLPAMVYVNLDWRDASRLLLGLSANPIDSATTL